MDAKFMIPIADDYAAIAARIAELKVEAREDVVCLLCEGKGWVDRGFVISDHIVCEACGNPEGRPSP